MHGNILSLCKGYHKLFLVIVKEASAEMVPKTIEDIGINKNSFVVNELMKGTTGG